MKVVDSFIFCAAYEKELLLLKFILESPCVDEWVGAECHYDYRGRRKGPILEELLRSDPRFAPYRDRVHVISLAENLSGANPDDPSLEGVTDPPQYAEAEWRLRDAALPYLLSKYDDWDRVFVTDVDEMVDFTDADRRDRMMHHLKSDLPWQHDRVRYIYDFDIRAFREEFDCITPSYRIGHLRLGQARLRDKKWVGIPVPNGERPMVFEYCFCFEREGIYQKLESSLHTKWSRELIDLSLETNHWTRTSYQTLDYRNRYLWFERVQLTDDNSPLFVRQHFDQLRTNLVPEDYQTRRLARFNFVANFEENVG